MTILRHWEGWRLTPFSYRGIVNGTHGAGKAQRRKRTLEKIVLSVLHEQGYHDILTGQPDSTLTRQQLNKLVGVIHKQARTAQDLRHMQHFLHKGLQYGNAIGLWQVAVPDRLTIEHAQHNPVTPPNARRRHDFSLLDQAHKQLLASPDFFNDTGQYLHTVRKKYKVHYTIADLRLGQLLFSAAAYGGLVHGRWLNAFIDALEEGPAMYHEHVSLELTTKVKKKVAEKEYINLDRRWFCDPWTAFLLYRWYHDGLKSTLNNNNTRNNAWHCLRAYLTVLPVNTDSGALYQQRPDPMPHTMTGFLDMVSAHLYWLVHPMLMQYARLLMDSTGLPERAWFRLTQDCRLAEPDNPSNAEVETTQMSGTTESLPHQWRSADQNRLLRSLKECLPNKNEQGAKNWCRRQVKEWLDEQRSAGFANPMLLLIASWALNLLNEGTRRQKVLAVTSVTRYVQAVSDNLLAVAQDETLAADLPGFSNKEERSETETSVIVEDADWQIAYDAAIERAPGKQDYLVGRLDEFHHFLMYHFDVTPVDLPGILNEHQVDANILTAAEYERAFQLVELMTTSQRERLMLRLTLVLGLKCGLRRGEIAAIRLRDVKLYAPEGQRLTEPELIVRNTRHSTVKTDSGKRHLPLKPLLSSTELDCLYELFDSQFRVADRAFQGSKRQPHERGNALLFSDPGYLQECLPQRRLFLPITRLLHHVSGDPSLRFHHLRHTSANRVFLGLHSFKRPYVMLPNWYVYEDEDSEEAEQAANHFRQLLNGPTDVSPHELYATALSLGHASPDETRRSYLHCFDWLLYRTCREYAPTMSLAIQANLMNKSSNSLEQWRWRNGLKDQQNAGALWDCFALASDIKRVLNRSSRYDPEAGRPPASLSELPENLVKEMSQLKYLKIQTLHAVLSEYSAGNVPAEILAQRYDISTANLERWFEQTRFMSMLQTKQDYPRFSSEYAKRIKKVKKRQSQPLLKAPRSQTELADASRIYDNILSLAEQSHDWVCRMLWFAVEHLSEGRMYRAPDPDSLREFIKFQRAIGIPDERITLWHFPATSAIALTDQQVYWARKTQVPPDQIIDSQKWQSRDNPYGIGAVRIAAPINPKPRKDSRNVHYRYSSPGHRFAMYMAAIVLLSEADTTARAAS